MKFSESTLGSDSAYWIKGAGVITADTPAQFEAFMKSESLAQEPTDIELSGEGGNLDAALRLGRLFRKHRISVVVMSDTQCLSACAYAFLGGLGRHVSAYPDQKEQHQLGFHRFNGPLATVPGVSERKSAAVASLLEAQSQVTSSELATYLSDMGVDARLLGLASAIPFDEMTFPDLADLEALKVTYEPEEHWTLEMNVEGETLVSAIWIPYLIPEQVAFACTPNELGASAPTIFITKAKGWFGRDTLPASVIAPVRSKVLPGGKYDGLRDQYFAITVDETITTASASYRGSLPESHAWQRFDLRDMTFIANDKWAHIRVRPEPTFFQRMVLAPGTFSVDVDFDSLIFSYFHLEYEMTPRNLDMVRATLRGCVDFGSAAPPR